MHTNYINTYICVYIYIYIYICIHIYISISMSIYIYTYTYICICMHISCVFIYMCIYLYIYIDKYIHDKCIHEHIYIHIDLYLYISTHYLSRWHSNYAWEKILPSYKEEKNKEDIEKLTLSHTVGNVNLCCFLCGVFLQDSY